MSCNAMSSPQFAKATPVNPPTVNRKMNPKVHNIGVLNSSDPPHMVANQLKILIPVGTAIIMVAAVKYARLSTSIPTEYMWCAQTTNPNTPIDNMA